ncbi:protein CMSS1 isoform 1-T1 [Dama dama]|uniref:protein CMSS1 isoform X1 n=1 Tax=Dama dama TaxID=30532 RepID=UPI002A35E416|nr:protein CMSS1 isoform X1 [Dama dama]
MADDLGDEWWENQPAGAASSPVLHYSTQEHLPTMQETRVQSLGREDLLEKEMATHSSILAWKILWMEESGASDDEGGGDTEMAQQDTAPGPALSKKIKPPKECFLIQPKETNEDAAKTRKRKKKKITDILAKSEPKPGTPEDLQQLMKDYYSTSRSVIELEELALPDSCFLKANDLTHSLSSYLKEVCPKWVKLRKNHNEKKSVLMLIICGSAIRALELIRSMTAFKGDSKVMKLFAKHIKVQEQVKLLEKRVVHLGVGTPGRIKELIKQGGLHLNPLKFLIFDWNWRDQKLRRMMDIPEIRKEVFELLEMGLLSLCKTESLKLGLF